jgi:hypothetical protein
VPGEEMASQHHLGQCGATLSKSVGAVLGAQGSKGMPISNLGRRMGQLYPRLGFIQPRAALRWQRGIGVKALW